MTYAAVPTYFNWIIHSSLLSEEKVVLFYRNWSAPNFQNPYPVTAIIDSPWQPPPERHDREIANTVGEKTFPCPFSHQWSCLMCWFRRNP